jgi:hypothetical protein
MLITSLSHSGYESIDWQVEYSEPNKVSHLYFQVTKRMFEEWLLTNAELVVDE